MLNLHLLTAEDILYASTLALILTWIITNISRAFNTVIRFPVEYKYGEQDITRLLRKCYALFPREKIRFHGETFKRGMRLRITTIHSTIIEGQLIGINHENMLCVLTPRNLVAQKIDGITEIILIEASASQ